MQIDFNSHVAKYTMFYSDFIVGKSYETFFTKWATSTKWYPNDQTAGSVLYEMIRMLYHNWEVYTTNEDAFGYSMNAILTSNLRYYDEKLKKYQEEFNWKVSKLESIKKAYSGNEVKHENTTGSIVGYENTSDNTSITETDDPHKMTETKYDLPRATASQNRPSQIVETENEEHIKETEGNKTFNKENEVNSGSILEGNKTNNDNEEINYEGYNDLLELRKKYLEQVQDLIKEFARKFQPLFLEVFA